MSDLKILNVQNDAERSEMLERCVNLYEKQALVPVIGAGFSVGTFTDNKGKVPSVKDLHKILFKYIAQFSAYDQEDLDEIEKENLAELASSFWDIYDRITEAEQEAFFKYIADNFQNISFFKKFQEEFLDIRWPCLFTLNYDSLVEDYSKNYYPIIPFNKINKHFDKDKTKLFKLHGDAKKYLETGDKKYLILSRDQYIQSMMDTSNNDMLNELLTAFASKSILFFGCGLSEELDLLYSSQLALQEKAKSIDPIQQSIIYISFEDEKELEKPFSKRKTDKLERYGVTTVFRISSENESECFWKELRARTKHVPQPGVESFLEKYSSIQFQSLRIDDIRCRDFLFQENLVWDSLNNHTVTMPGFNVERSKVLQAAQFISSNEPLCFISGNFFSGKTFFLLQVAQRFAMKKVYLFPAGTNLTDQQLNVLMQKHNALYCFDSKSLTTTQIKEISSEKALDSIKKHQSSAIIVIDKSDAPMYKYIFEAKNVARTFTMFSLSSKFDEREAHDFNKKIGGISLPPYKNKETLLDYIVHNEIELLGSRISENYFLEPQKELLAKDTERRIKALVMLATEIRIPARRAIQFRIDTAINDIINCCEESESSSVIERDYSNYNGESSGYEYVCNSKYWIIRALSTYAKVEKHSIEIIANAYLSIIEVYRSIYSNDDIGFYQNCEPYYFFDHIQTLFNHRWFPNSSKLMNEIYDKLLPRLSDSYQFLHQKAKGKLVIAQVQLKRGNYRAARSTLTEAVYNITRAKELAKKYPDAKNIAETRLHMTYTEARVYIEYSCISDEFVPQAVNCCYELYHMQNHSKHDVYDFAAAVGNDKWAFNKFKQKLILENSVYKYKELDGEKVTFLLMRWTGKHFRVPKARKK